LTFDRLSRSGLDFDAQLASKPTSSEMARHSLTRSFQAGGASSKALLRRRHFRSHDLGKNE